ncbi:MAG: T9SS type A sorting domain-containing protein [Bacteroidia bacterium]|nr:T9SS type A sorting domain-containing protein [Bacteroidia bacterium]
MKRKLLFGTAAIIAISGITAQNARQNKPVGIINYAEKLSLKFSSDPEAKPYSGNSAFVPSNAQMSSSELKTSGTQTAVAQFTMISRSENIFGALVSHSKPLDYNNELNTVSFVHRKSPTYPVPGSGVIVVDLYKNMTTWDSTCVWEPGVANDKRGRYPQGSILNPVGNTNLNNAYVVATGPVTSGSGWTGGFYTHKQIGAAGTTVVPTTTVFAPNTPPYHTIIKKNDFPRYSFSSMDNGVFYSLGIIANDINASGAAAQALRGAALISGSIVAGNMVYKYDSIIPTTIMHSQGYKVMFGQPWMAWNEAGTVGYVVFIGARPGQTLSNVGYQPIIYKTTNSGSSWTQVNSIDFNANANQPGYSKLLNSIYPVNTNTNLVIPFFTPAEGIDLTVDKNNNLHIVGTMVGTARNHPDSLGYTWLLPVCSNTTDGSHGWTWCTNEWPYIFDFTGDGSSNWTCRIIDSLSTEGPGTGSDPSAAWNAWGDVVSDSRIQVSRTNDGEYLIYTWAESDTNFTTNGFKWNQYPNLRAKVMNITSGVLYSPRYKLTDNTGNLVKDKAFFHYTSARSSYTNSCPTQSLFIRMPVVVSYNATNTSTVPVNNYYSTVSFSISCTLGSINNSPKGFISNAYAYPNPAQNFINVVTQMNKEGQGEISLYNLIGQVIYSEKTSFNVGENTNQVPVSNLTRGVYFLKIKSGNDEVTHKVIVE